MQHFSKILEGLARAWQALGQTFALKLANVGTRPTLRTRVRNNSMSPETIKITLAKSRNSRDTAAVGCSLFKSDSNILVLEPIGPSVSARFSAVGRIVLHFLPRLLAPI